MPSDDQSVGQVVASTSRATTIHNRATMANAQYCEEVKHENYVETSKDNENGYSFTSRRRYQETLAGIQLEHEPCKLGGSTIGYLSTEPFTSAAQISSFSEEDGITLGQKVEEVKSLV